MNTLADSAETGRWEQPPCRCRRSEDVCYDSPVTGYRIGREKGPETGVLPSFWKGTDKASTEHALSPRNDSPICGYEGPIDVTEDFWYESNSKGRCPTCMARSGHD
jgi:hypothetical protein